jgi:cytochrome b involved in lipid metabolism
MFSYFFGKKEDPQRRSNKGSGDQTQEHPDDSKPKTSKSADRHFEDANEESGEATPKAKAEPNGSLSSIPTLNLEPADDSDPDDDDLKHLPPPSFPALGSVQRASGSSTRGPPKLKPLSNGSASLDAKLMPPPPRPAARPSAPMGTAGMRVPTTGPLPNRLPPRNNNTLQLPSYRNTNPARQKVILGPGYSPLDWATLQKSGKNLAGVTSLVRVTPSMLKYHNGRKGRPAWSSYQGRVYNITPYLPFHPGGADQLRRAAGKDGEKLFNETHSWVNWENMLGSCCVGILVPEGAGDTESVLEQLD